MDASGKSSETERERVVLEHRWLSDTTGILPLTGKARAQLEETLRESEAAIKVIGPEGRVDMYRYLAEKKASLLEEVAATMGRSYRNVVRWCLRVEGQEKDEEDEGDAEEEKGGPSVQEFVKEVVEKLEDFASLV